MQKPIWKSFHFIGVQVLPVGQSAVDEQIWTSPLPVQAPALAVSHLIAVPPDVL